MFQLVVWKVKQQGTVIKCGKKNWTHHLSQQRKMNLSLFFLLKWILQLTGDRVWRWIRLGPEDPAAEDSQRWGHLWMPRLQLSRRAHCLHPTQCVARSVWTHMHTYAPCVRVSTPSANHPWPCVRLIDIMMYFWVRSGGFEFDLTLKL